MYDCQKKKDEEKIYMIVMRQVSLINYIRQ